MSCRLKDYYKEGIPLKKSMEIISGILDNVQEIVAKVRKDYTSVNLTSRNMESIGLLVHTYPPASPEVTPRGGTLVLSKRPYLGIDEKSAIHVMMGRFILLKAIRDSDWDCFKQFYRARYVELPIDDAKARGISDIIRKRYYPQFTKKNFYHWYRLHLSFMNETNARRVLGIDGSFGEPQFDAIDPYSELFSAGRFFGGDYVTPSLEEINEKITQALDIYVKNLSGGSATGYCETLKTIIQILLLHSNMFLNDLDLSDSVIRYLRKIGVGFMRSNYPILTGGRGFIDRRRIDQVSLVLFNLPSSYFR